MEHKSTRRYYKIGEEVFVKPEKKTGVVTKLDVDPENKVYKATVEITQLDGTSTIITRKQYDLWELDKSQKTRYKEKNLRSLVIPIRYFDNEVEELEEIEIGDWIDLRSRIDIDIKQFESARIPLNVAMRLPRGYEASLKPRSSTYDKWGIILANMVGTVDNSYQGNDDEWLFNAIALKGDTSIKKGDRIAQFKIVRKMDKKQFIFKKVDELRGPNRGGFGSTGSN